VRFRAPFTHTCEHVHHNRRATCGTDRQTRCTCPYMALPTGLWKEGRANPQLLLVDLSGDVLSFVLSRTTAYAAVPGRLRPRAASHPDARHACRRRTTASVRSAIDVSHTVTIHIVIHVRAPFGTTRRTAHQSRRRPRDFCCLAFLTQLPSLTRLGSTLSHPTTTLAATTAAAPAIPATMPVAG
jgi:hypothetical protein